MSHLAFITGPADFLNLFSYLEHHKITAAPITVVLFGNHRNVSGELRRATEKLTEQLTNSSFYFLNSDSGLDGIDGLRQQISSSMAATTNLFITHVFGRFENLILDTFAYERLVLVENGLATYYPPVGRDPRFQRNYYLTKPIKHVHEAWLPLAQFIGCPFYLSEDVVESPSAQDFKSSAAELAQRTQTMQSGDDAGQKMVFVAGTSLYRLGVISESEEIDCYERFIDKTANTNVDRIYWKPHPRMNVDSDRLSSISRKVTTLVDPMPLEFHFLSRENRHISCASIASSSLLFGKYFFGAEPSRIPTEFANETRFPHLTLLKRLVTND